MNLGKKTFYRVAVIGCGYVGLSMAVLLSRQNQVIAADIDQRKVDLLNRRMSPIADHDIEECLNDTYLKLWENAKNYDFAKASLKNYSVVIARNIAISRLRSIGRYSFVEAYEDETLSLENTPSPTSTNPEQILITKENIQTIKELLMKIKGTDRKILELKYFYMLDSANIGKTLGLSVSAVDNRMYKLRKKLRLLLTQEMQK